MDVTNSINTIAHGRFLVPREAKPRPKNANAIRHDAAAAAAAAACIKTREVLTVALHLDLEIAAGLRS